MTEKLSVSELTENYNAVKKRLSAALQKAGRPENAVTLLAATKTVDPETINRAIELGITHIGENRVQELLEKYPNITSPGQAFFIGHLQTNKVKDIIDKVEMIESVHSEKLAAEISKQACKAGITMDILLEVNIGNEESKSGFAPEETEQAVRKIAEMPGISVKGLMAIPPIDPLYENTRKYFRNMYKLFIDIRGKNIDNIRMDMLSMGMSSDYEQAILEGSTLVRIGSALFGRRL